MGGSPSGIGGLGQSTGDFNAALGGPSNFNWGNLFGGGDVNQMSPANKPLQAQYSKGPLQANPAGGVGSLDWMKWHPDYKPTVGTAAWGATHPDPAQNVKYGSAQWQQTHPNYGGFGGQQQPQLGQPSGDLSDVIRRLFGGGQ